jgi:hypothetical protein
MSKMTLTTEGDREIVVTRPFAAPPEFVFRAHIEPALIQQWMLGPEGWSMPLCASDARHDAGDRHGARDGSGVRPTRRNGGAGGRSLITPGADGPATLRAHPVR